MNSLSSVPSLGPLPGSPVLPQLTQPLPVLEWVWRGYTIRYTQMGEGAPLVLVHGFGASLGHWRHNIPVLAGAGYRVFALDLLGFGRSDKPAIAYSLDVWRELLGAFWQEHIQEPTVFVGNSIGALVCLMVLAEAPEQARAGILLNCAGGLNHRPEELKWPLRMVMGAFTQAVTSPVIGSLLFNWVRQRFNIRRTLYQVYRNRAAVTDELVELLHGPACDPGAQQVFASILSAPAGPSPASLLPRVTQPLLVLWGEDDPWTPVTGGKVFEEADTETIEFLAIPETGHCPHDERPEVVNTLILDWLGRIA